VLDQSWIGHNLVGAWGAAAPDAAGRGGGIYVGVGNGTITNCTVAGNPAAEAGAIGTQGYLDVTHATIARNAATRGGALRQFDIGTTYLENSIVGENSPANCFGTLPTDLGHNLETSNSTCTPLGDYDAGVNLEPPGYYGGPTRSMPPLPTVSPSRVAPLSESTLTSAVCCDRSWRRSTSARSSWRAVAPGRSTRAALPATPTHATWTATRGSISPTSTA
jgi:hypothetical protein